MQYGDKFEYCGYTWVYLDDIGNGILAVASSSLRDLKFANNSQEVWEKSYIRDILNSDLLSQLDVDDLLLQQSDMTADNGDRSLGSVSDYISLLSTHQIRKYRDLLPDYNKWVWTLTPWSVGEPYVMMFKSPSGGLNYGSASTTLGVAPLVLIKKSAIRNG